jgi:heavy metal translocating P-type ATPase
VGAPRRRPYPSLVQSQVTHPAADPQRLPRLPHELSAAVTAGVLLASAFVLRRLDINAPADAIGWLSLAIGLVYGGWAAMETLVRGRFDIDALMVLAAGLAAWAGHPDDGALLMFLFILSGALEERAMQRTRRAVEALHKLMPTRAVVWREDAAKPAGWTDAEPETLRPGERILIKTGELVPTDSRITLGRSSIDQATLTGESLPRTVEVGDEIYAGTINLDNPIEAHVLRPTTESSLQRILNLVIEAQQQREPIQRVIDRLSQPYAICVVLVSLAVLLLWWKVLGFPLLSPSGAPDALTTAITLLIVASPCALVIATPTATLAAISRAARAGVLFKGGQAIERLARVAAVGMDKTGTLTFGAPRLTQVHPVAWSDGPELLAVAAALESGSTHPIAAAIIDAAKARRIHPFHAEDHANTPGHGLSGVINAREARLGTYEHAEPLIPVCLRARTREVLAKVRARGNIGVVIAWAGPVGPNGEPGPDAAGEAAVFVLADAIRPGARALVDRLHELGVRPVRMLTGDNEQTAAYIAAQLGLDAFDAALLPQDKVRVVEDMKAELRAARSSRQLGRAVAVIGDGVNDAPALAAADVSIAIGSIGSDAALESADIVLLNDDLIAIPWAVRLARRTRGVVAFNLLVALGIIIAMAATTLIGSLVEFKVPLPAAVFAHEGGTLLVVLNSLRLLLTAQPAHEPPADVSWRTLHTNAPANAPVPVTG